MSELGRISVSRGAALTSIHGMEATIADNFRHAREALADYDARAPRLGESVVYRMSATEARRGEARDHAAIVTFVYGPNMVNLTVFIDGLGVSVWRKSVERFNPDEPTRASWRWSE